MMRLSGLAILLVFVSGCLGPIKELYPDDPEKRPLTVYLISHGLHAGIAIESSAIEHTLPDHKSIPQTEWLKFSWGDDRYYPDTEPSIWLALRAALLPTGSVLHVVGFNTPVKDYFSASTIIKIQIAPEGAQAMGKFIADYFRLDEAGRPRFRADGLYDNSVFFEATGRYYFPKTSNTWTARALRKTGYPITPFYAITSDNLIQQARRDGEVIQ